MKKTLWLCLLLTATWVLQAQDSKLRIAVFDPTSSGTTVDEGTKVAVREIISSAFVNTGKYIIVERSLLDKVMKEQEFSNTDNVDESQATELGRLAGANKVAVSVVTLVGGRNMLSIKVIDVKTATIDQQKTKIVSSNDLLDIVEPLTLELLGEKVPESTTIAASSTPAPAPKPTVETTPKPVTPPAKKPDPAPVANALVRSVSNFIRQDLAGKANRYNTEEERFDHLGAKGDLKELVNMSAKPIFSIPPDSDNSVIICYVGKSGGGDKPLFLFFNGTLIGVGSMNKGFSVVLPNSGASGSLTIWTLSDKIFTTPVNFSAKSKYIFIRDKNRLLVQ
jgi:hypothetical protein